MMRVDAGVVGLGRHHDGPSWTAPADARDFRAALQDARDAREAERKPAREENHSREEEEARAESKPLDAHTHGESEAAEDREPAVEVGLSIHWMHGTDRPTSPEAALAAEDAEPSLGFGGKQRADKAPGAAQTGATKGGTVRKASKHIAASPEPPANSQGGAPDRATKEAVEVFRMRGVEELKDVAQARPSSLGAAAGLLLSARGRHEHATFLPKSEARGQDQLAALAAVEGGTDLSLRAAAATRAVQSVPRAADVEAWTPQLRMRVLRNGGEASLELELLDGTRARLDVRVVDGRLDAQIHGVAARHRAEVLSVLEALRGIAGDAGLEAGDFGSHEGEGERDGGETPHTAETPEAHTSAPIRRGRPVHTGLIDLVV